MALGGEFSDLVVFYATILENPHDISAYSLPFPSGRALLLEQSSSSHLLQHSFIYLFSKVIIVLAFACNKRSVAILSHVY